MKLLMAALLLALPLAQDKVELRWKWVKGQELVYKSSQKTSLEFGGQPMDQAMGYTYSLTVEDVAASGEATIKVKYLAIFTRGNGPQGEFDYDSEKDKEAPKEGPAAMQAKMVGQTFTMKMTPVGKVTDAVWSPGLSKNIGYVWVPIELSEPGNVIDVDCEHGPVSGRTAAIPFVDPRKERPAGSLRPGA